MPDRVIAIGDIHGCSTALSSLLDAIHPQASDTLVPLGDYVDRGPDTPGALDLLIRLREACQLVPILGNHDQMFLNVMRGELDSDLWAGCGGAETLESYHYAGDFSIVPARHVEFLEQCIDFYETDTHFFVHANYDAGVPLENQNDIALRWRKLSEEVPLPHVSGKIAVVGHTPNEEGKIFDVGHLRCIDTYCYGGRWLTAIDVTTDQVWQADQEGNVREDECDTIRDNRRDSD